MFVIPYTQSLSCPLLFTDRVLIHPLLCKLLNALIKLLIRKSVGVPTLLLDLAPCPRYSAVGLRFFPSLRTPISWYRICDRQRFNVAIVQVVGDQGCAFLCKHTTNEQEFMNTENDPFDRCP